MHDSLHLRSGVTVRGAGAMTVLRKAKSVEVKLELDGDQQYGVNIIRRALEEPLRQIAGNAGAEGAVVVNRVREGTGAYGYNAASGVYEDLVEAGVVDPTKVLRVALQNAASVSSLMLTTEVMIAERSKSSAASPGMRDAMGGMGM